MVNWKKWFLEEDEDEIYKAEEGRRDKQKNIKERKTMAD